MPASIPLSLDVARRPPLRRWPGERQTARAVEDDSGRLAAAKLRSACAGKVGLLLLQSIASPGTPPWRTTGPRDCKIGGRIR